MARIRHIALFSDDPEHLAKFYVDVFGMTINGKSEADGSVWLTDGYMDIALLRRRSEMAPEGLHHFGITIEADEKEGVYRRLKENDAWVMKPPPGRPYVEDAAKDADGNKFDISTSAVKVDGNQVEMKDQKRVVRPEKIRTRLTKQDSPLDERYAGPIEVGMVFDFEPGKKHKYERLTIERKEGQNVWARGRSGQTFYDEDEFRHSVVFVSAKPLHKPQPVPVPLDAR